MEILAAQADPGVRIGVFAESLHAEETPELRELERKALGDGIPIIRPHTRGLIQCILEMKAPRRILEIGTATGYSALVMYTYAPPGGVLLTDNVLKEGEILESKFAVTRRDRTIHKRMREYLSAISRDERLRTVLLETGDGAAISVRRRG